MQNRRFILMTFTLLFAIVIAVLVILFLSRSAVANAQAKSMQSIFQLIQQQAKNDPKFPFTIESYAPPVAAGTQGLVVGAINASANSIVEIGEDYVCLGSIQMGSTDKDIKTVCVPYSAIVRVQMQNTLFK